MSAERKVSCPACGGQMSRLAGLECREPWHRDAYADELQREEVRHGRLR